MHLNTLFRYWTYRLFAPGLVLRETYDAFRELLALDSRSHELMADLEDLYYQGKKEDFCRITARYNAFSASVGGMVEGLERMAPGSFVTLREYFRKYDFYNRLLLSPPTLHFAPPFVLPLADTAAKQDLAGAKSATLAEIADCLRLPVPTGFVITVNSFNYLLEYNDLRGQINDQLSQIDPASPASLARTSFSLVDCMKKAEIPPDILEAIRVAQTSVFGDAVRLAVRSSAAGEDGECSFAGQYASVLNVGKDRLVESYRLVLASKYTPEALAYRIHCGFSDEETPMAVQVVKMIDALAGGVVYSRPPTSPDAGHLLIHAVRGQGEALVGGRAVPEVLVVDRGDLSCQRKKADLQPVLTDEQARTLAGHALKIEAHFGAPQDIEWALSETGEVCILQSRPLQTQAQSPPAEEPMSCEEIHEMPGEPLFRGGTMAAPGQACGPAYCIDGEHPVEQVPAGGLLGVGDTLPSYVQVLERVGGVLAARGSLAGHFSTVCREYGVPLLCGLGEKIRGIPHGRMMTMQAEKGVVYQGCHLPARPSIPLYESRKNLPFYRKLRRLLDGITPLHLIDPQAKGFVPEACRSLHDIIRFVHEQAVRTMFSLGDRLGTPGRNRKRLVADLPFEIFIVDVGGGLDTSAAQEEKFRIEQVRSAPFLALWAGFFHPSVQWQDRAHFNWGRFGDLILADGISSPDAPEFASYAVLGADYVNLIMRFGYHFSLVDVLAGEDSVTNYCQFRFSGGGADFPGRLLRLDFISTLLKREGFQIETRGDLLDARLSAMSVAEMEVRLTMLGRLLGITRLMDMTLHDHEEVQRTLQDFLDKS